MRNKIVGLSVAFIVTACGGGGSSSNPSTPTSNKTLPTISLSVDKSNLNVFQTATLSWSATDATSCSGSWSSDIGVSGTKVISSTKEESLQFTINCANANGSATKSTTVKVAVPELSMAGVWAPADKSSLTATYAGDLGNTFRSLVNMGNGNYGLVVSGWGIQSDTKSTTNPLINVAFFESVGDGTLKLNTSQYITNPLTHGAGSIVANDFNYDGKDDIFILPLNETPFVARQGVVYFSTATGFKRQDLVDSVNAHDFQLVRVNNTTKIVTSTFSEKPRNLIYEVSGETVSVKVPNLINIDKISPTYFNISGMSNTIITNKDGSKKLVSGAACALNPAGGCFTATINVFGYDGYDITSGEPDQKITPYLSSTGKFTTLKSLSGTNNTHVYRLWSIDLNHDGNEDVLAGTSMWSAGSRTFPSMLQVLINNGNGSLVDRTEALNPSMDTDSEEMDYSPSFIDIDNSGIKTLFLSGSYANNPLRQSNYILLNDGTGKLYPALHKEFEMLAQKVYDFLTSKNYINSTNTFPKFIAVPNQNGSINFVAEIFSKYNSSQTNFYYVNVPLSYNPKTDFTTNVSVSDRNNSMKIRTWAGDDTITDKNAVTGTRIDGGLGKNKVTYSSASTNYSVTKNNDGSYRVTNTANKIDDTLVRIHNIVFTDKTITLE